MFFAFLFVKKIQFFLLVGFWGLELAHFINLTVVIDWLQKLKDSGIYKFISVISYVLSHLIKA